MGTKGEARLMTRRVTAEQRRIVAIAIAASIVGAGVMWKVLLRFLPSPANAEPLATAIGCSAVAALLALLPGIEAIAHERLVTSAIDPLSGVESSRMRVNFRYLSNTLEQFVVFAIGLLALSAYVPPRLLLVVTIVWVLARWAFWIGYHLSPLLRALGAAGIAQNLIVLAYAAYHYGLAAYGPATGIAIVAIYVGIEAFLFWATSRPAQ